MKHKSVKTKATILLALIAAFAANTCAFAELRRPQRLNPNVVPEGLNASDWVGIQQQAYLKSSSPEAVDLLGWSVAVSGDTVVVGAYREDSNATGVNGDHSDNTATDSGAAYVFVRDASGAWTQQAYLKASNTEGGEWFGWAVSISGDTIVVGAVLENSGSAGVNGDQNNNDVPNAGAAYVFVRTGTNWTQQAYLKASNTGEEGDFFGDSVTISGDTIVVDAPYEDSNATGVNGDQDNNDATDSGAAYVFVRDGTNWTQQAYLKASNTDAGDIFFLVALSGDTLVVGAPFEASSATGVNGDESNNSATRAGAAYVFARSGTNWTQQAYLKASNTGAGDVFGAAVAVSDDTVVVGAWQEDSNAAGINGDESNNSAPASGAAYVFVRDGTNWSQQAYLKASNTEASDLFGGSVAVSGDTVVVGAPQESSSATGVNGDQGDNGAFRSGAAYVFVRTGTNWTQKVYLKASNTGENDGFGGGLFGMPSTSVAVSGDTIVVGARGEKSKATGVNGDQSDNSLERAGAAYVFTDLGISPRLVVVPDGSGGYFIRLDGVPEWAYRLERATGLGAPWDTIDSQIAPASGMIEYHDSNAPTGQAFYRVAVEIPVE